MPGHSSSSSETIWGFRPPSRGSMAAGSKKYAAARVATIRTAWPLSFSPANRSGVFVAATEPVTPSKMLGMLPLRQPALDGVDELLRQFLSRDSLVAAKTRSDKCVMSRAVQRVRHDQICIRLQP